MLVAGDDAERTGNDAIATAVADVLLDIDSVELGTNNGTGRASFLAGRVGAVFANIALHQPTVSIKERQRCA